MKTFFLTLVFCLSVGLCGDVFSSSAAQPQKIAILPFIKGGQENIDYIADALRDMIASRVASGSGLAVIEPGMVKAKFPGAGKEMLPPEKLMNIGKTLGADYLIYGSIAQMGGALIIAVNMLSMPEGGAVFPVFTQTLALDEVIPRMQLLAQEVRDSITDGLQNPEADSAVLPAPEEPEVKAEEGTAGGSPAGGPADSGDMLNDLLQDDGPEETTGAAPASEPEPGSGSETAEEKEEGSGGLRKFLLERKDKVDSPPENPVYDKAVDDLQGDAKTKP